MRKRFALSKAETPEILTYGSLERWSMIITTFEIMLKKIREGQQPPILVRTYEIDDYGYNTNSVRNTIDILKNAGVLIPHEKKIQYEVKIAPKGIELLKNDLIKWDKIKEKRTLDSLRLFSLKILGEILDEIDALLKRPVGKQT
jgi:predicted transcriptional regulator